MYSADIFMENPNSVSTIPRFRPVGSLHHETSFAACRWIGTGPVAGTRNSGIVERQAHKAIRPRFVCVAVLWRVFVVHSTVVPVQHPNIDAEGPPARRIGSEKVGDVLAFCSAFCCGESTRYTIRKEEDQEYGKDVDFDIHEGMK